MNLSNHSQESKARCPDSGFSLVEVTIAMAIAAVAVATLMGLIPQGITTMREAGDEAIIGRIHQQILNEIQMADFDALDIYHEMEVYYDDQGEELSNSKNQATVLDARKQGAFAHVYTARISVPSLPGQGSSNNKMPQSVGGADFVGVSFDNKATVNPLLRSVVIEVAAVAGLGVEFKWESEEHRRLIKIYQTNVAKMGRAFQ